MIKVRTGIISFYNSTNESSSRQGTRLRRDRSGALLLKFLLSLCCIAGACCYHAESTVRVPRGIKELQAVLNSPQPTPTLGHCDFEYTCDWTWNRTTGLAKTSAPVANQLGPTTDASESPTGHFLWLSGQKETQIRSKLIPRTGTGCLLEMALYQVEMENGAIRLIIETYNRTSWVAADRAGNNHAKWEVTRFNLGAISQPYQLVLEMAMPSPDSGFGVDNIRLLDCFPECLQCNPRDTCTENMFRCNNNSCLNNTRICDLTADCSDGEDELQECDKVPENARCNFEYGWCGWSNEPSRLLNWTLHQGPTPTDRTGPSYDHTYRNATGTYAYVDMSGMSTYGNRATLRSPVYNPTPPYSSDRTNPYFQSCQVRFFYHQYGVHSGSLGLNLVRIMQRQNQSERLWWNYGDQSDMWYDQAVPLPVVRQRYYLQFEASKGLAQKGDVAIDDVSLSPECFGIGVPPKFAGGFNYYNPVIDWSIEPERHPDFANETVVKVSTCGATGRLGPTTGQCAAHNNRTGIELLIPPSTTSSSVETDDRSAMLKLDGIQRWTAPRGGHYTIIGMGAGGGKGSGGMGSTLGAMVRAVIELDKGQQLYFMVGQPGVDACPKNLGLKNNSCQSSNWSKYAPGAGISALVRQVKKIEMKDGGGGGGGATYVFTLKPNGEQQPLLIAAGGGGLGKGQFVDDGAQHGQGPPTRGKSSGPGLTIKGNAGAGGGWNGSLNNLKGRMSAGGALILGGMGGAACKADNGNHSDSGLAGDGNRSHGDGGFGGGGGGCLSGGGGGGYIGGGTGDDKSVNGEGGYSYASPELLHVSFRPGVNEGPGHVYIIPAISGCGCDFRCVAVDQHLSETKCLCPQGWHLGNDTRSCLIESGVDSRTFMILLIAVSVSLLFAFSGLCALLYNRYQHRKALLRRRQVMFGNGTELTRLPAVSDNMMTEFNPNYEFAGNLYSFKDLPQIPRDNISLVKPLGQGAFGEVFQGIYKYRRNEEHPVAVKTLPSLSTSQAEADFMMEALIMSKFNHPNIVHFIGVSFDKHPRYIVLELLAGGDLKIFLREERPRPDRRTTLSMQDLVMCAYDVANGCKYMEDTRFIHRDIAARNCLLTCKEPGRIVKIADFGMARDIYRSDYYRKGGKAMLPIKWMPPESFLDGTFSTKTDVWAFGVLLWEIMSFGYMPYTGCANREVMSMVTTGGRLERPAGCPDPIYGVMTQCWHPDPKDRPSFSTIVERIGYCLQDPDVIDHPMPNYDILPACEREITIMRPDPETECINVRSSLDGCGYMQPRANFRPASYRIGPAPGIVYASLRHCDDCEHENVRMQETALTEPKNPQDHCLAANRTALETHDDKESNKRKTSTGGETNANDAGSKVDNVRDESCVGNFNSNVLMNGKPHGQNGNGESTTTTDTNSDSLVIPSSNSPPDTSVSSPNTRTSSPSHTKLNANVNNNNGILRKSALKAALSLDPSALCRGTIPYEKIAFSPPPPRLSNPGSTELRKGSLGRELPREEECSC